MKSQGNTGKTNEKYINITIQIAKLSLCTGSGTQHLRQRMRMTWSCWLLQTAFPPVRSPVLTPCLQVVLVLPPLLALHPLRCVRLTGWPMDRETDRPTNRCNVTRLWRDMTWHDVTWWTDWHMSWMILLYQSSYIYNIAKCPSLLCVLNVYMQAD